MNYENFLYLGDCLDVLRNDREIEPEKEISLITSIDRDSFILQL